MIRQIQIAIALILLIATNAATWYLTRQHDQNRMYEVQLGTAKAIGDEMLRQQDIAAKRLAIINQTQVQHDKDQITINHLADSLKRMQVHGICGGAVQAGTGTSANQNEGAWTFSEGVDANFARLQFRASELFRECDQMNIDAIRSNGQGVGIEPMK